MRSQHWEDLPASETDDEGGHCQQNIGSDGWVYEYGKDERDGTRTQEECQWREYCE
jgi:hypothetical protein